MHVCVLHLGRKAYCTCGVGKVESVCGKKGVL